MKADFSRFTHDPSRHYTAVLKQQGRVDLDADTNEAALIEDHLDRTRLLDLLCGCAFPRHASGFDVSFAETVGEPDLQLSAGRAYIGGRLCQVPVSPTGQPATYLTQPFYPAPPPLNPVEGRRDLVYLDVWQRHVTALEDPHIREVALGGPDTATRLQTVWQVKVAQGVPATAQCCDCPRVPELEARGRLSARLTPVPPSDDPCVIGPGAGYRGLENRLYRVEIHDEGEALNAAAPTALPVTTDATTTSIQFTTAGWSTYPTPWRIGQLLALSGTVSGSAVQVLARVTALEETQRRLTFATDNEDLNALLATGTATARRVKSFKWSRDNGSVAFAIESFDAPDQLIARRTRHDRVLALDLDQVVEIAGTETDLLGGPGTLATLTDLDQADRRVTLDTDVSRHSTETFPKIRRWDHPPTDTDVTMANGAIVVETGRTYELEDGIEVEFYDGPSIAGDYWTFAARAAASAAGSTLEGFETAPPAGIDHDYCCLALLTWTEQLEDRFSKVDCRSEFPCLTELDEAGGCCIDVRPGEDLRAAIATAIAAGGGRVCLCAGVHNLTGPLPLTRIQNLTLTGQGPSTVLQLHGLEGRGGIYILGSRRIRIEHMVVLGNDVPALVNVASQFATADREQPAPGPAHTVVLHELQLINLDPAPVRPPTPDEPPRGITGILTTDDDCRPAAGVQVFVRGTLRSTTTDDAGRYTLSAWPNETLVYYAPGYSPVTVAVLDQSVLDIVLRPLPAPAIPQPFRCAVRLADTRDIRIDHCRMLSEVGVLSLWGSNLPPVPEPVDAPPSEDGGDPVVTETTATFEGLQSGTVFPPGSTLTDPGSGLIFTLEGPAGISARVSNEGPPRGNVLFLNNIVARLSLPQPVQQLTLRYGSFGGTITLDVNGTVRVVNDILTLNGQTIAGVRVTVTPDAAATARTGVLELNTVTAPISGFAIGGQEFFIDDVRILRQSVPQPEPPPREPVRYGNGVAQVHLHHVRIRSRDYGVLALRANHWHLDDSDLRPLAFPGSVPPDDPQALAAALDFLATDTSTALSTGFRRATSTAVKSCLWIDSTIAGSHLEGAIGFEAGLCVRGAIRSCTVQTTRRGLTALWIHAADWHHNRVTCTAGPALSFVGSFQTTFASNRVNAALGCLRLPWREALLRLHACLETAARAYAQPITAENERRVLWVFLEELVTLTRLRPLLEALQAVADAYHALALALGQPSPFGNWPPPLLWLLAGQLQPVLHTLATATDDDLPGWTESGVFVPIIALTLRGNEFQTTADSLVLEQFLTFGGCRIEENRFESAHGQTVVLNVWPYGANVSLVVYLIRTVLELLVEFLTRLDLDDLEAELPEILHPLAAALRNLLLTLRRTLAAWRQQIDGHLTTDYRIDRNTLHSLNTAIESNLFELAVTANHITLRPRPVANDTLTRLAAGFTRSPSLAALETATVEADVAGVDYRNDLLDTRGGEAGWHTNEAPAIERANLQFTDDPAAARQCPGTTPSASTPVGVANRPVTTLAWTRAEADLDQQRAAYDAAVTNRDTALARATYLQLGARLRSLLNSQGIWMKAPGCQVTGNHVIAPEGPGSNTRPRGGIRLQGDERIQALSFLLFLLEALLPNLDPLLGNTETLIADNEIIGGTGSGVDVFALAGSQTKASLTTNAASRVQGLQALFDLNVRGNQIRGLDTAGVSIDYGTLAVHVAVEHNAITGCGTGALRQSALLGEGGIVLDNAALCRIRGNRIRNCAPAGTLLRRVIGLHFDENRLQHNVLRTDNDNQAVLGLGLVGRQLYGQLHVADNEFLEHPSGDLDLRNPLRPTADAGLVLLILVARLHSGAFESDPTALPAVQALLDANIFRNTATGGRGLYRFNLVLPEGRLVLNANSAQASTPQTLGRLLDLRYLTVTNNLLDTPTSDNAPPLLIDLTRTATAIVTSNLATPAVPIRIVGLGSAVLHKANNHPPIP